MGTRNAPTGPSGAAGYLKSISAAPGIRVLERHLLPGTKDPVSLVMMRAIKSALDPTGILNPEKVL